MNDVQILTGGTLTMIQDLGRPQAQMHGVSSGGAADPFAMRIANRLVGNADHFAVMEMALRGPSLCLPAGSLIAVTGANLEPTIQGQPLPSWRPILILEEATIQFGSSRPGLGSRAYLAVAGGFDVPSVLGSRSTDLRIGFGGWQGRNLRQGDMIPVSAHNDFNLRMIKACRNMSIDSGVYAAPKWHAWLATTYMPVEHSGAEGVRTRSLRVVPGADLKQLTRNQQRTFFHDAFEVTQQTDRMGIRLSGPSLHADGALERSIPTLCGTVQLPPDGQPIVLAVDRQPTGGYPQVAHVSRADWPQLGQAQPGDQFRFRAVTVRHAQRAIFRQERALNDLSNSLQTWMVSYGR